jgi:hypothetical protein
VLGDNVQTAPKLASRLVDDVDAALSFLDAGEQLILMYESIPVETSGITATLAAMPSQERIDSVRSLILQSHTALSGAEATANKVNDRRLWGRLGSEAEELRNQEAELRDLVDWSLLVTDSLSALARLSDESEGLTRMIDTGDTSDLDGSVLRRMPILEIRAKRASTAVSITVDTAPDVMAETPIGRIFRDLKPVLKALHATSRAGSLVSAGHHTSVRAGRVVKQRSIWPRHRVAGIDRSDRGWHLRTARGRLNSLQVKGRTVRSPATNRDPIRRSSSRRTAVTV